MNVPSDRMSLDPSIEGMIRSVQSGSEADLGSLVETYRVYLLSVARQQLSRDLAVKVAPSDLVQDAMLQASQKFQQFRGTTEEELRQWLQTIVIRNVIDTHRHFRGVRKRNLAREIPLEQSNCSPSLIGDLEGREESPSTRMRQSESAAALHSAMSRLPEEYQFVIRQHSFEKIGFDQIGKHLNRSADATRKLWARAIERLTRELGSNDSDSARRIRRPSC